MKKIIHKANTRGHSNHGWLDSYHTFSFADYFNPERMNFGLLRVLNDDVIDPGTGFGTHPHNNMEIISVPISGSLEHKDSQGSNMIIKTGDIQIMSAGTGVTHSEYNHSNKEKTNFLQIWVLPKEKNIKPRYEQKTFPFETRKNKIQRIVSPDKEKNVLWINQNAYFYLGHIDINSEIKYDLVNKKHGVYIFVINGEVSINDEKLSQRDGIGIWNIENLSIKTYTETEFLIIEVPLL